VLEEDGAPHFMSGAGELGGCSLSCFLDVVQVFMRRRRSYQEVGSEWKETVKLICLVAWLR